MGARCFRAGVATFDISIHACTYHGCWIDGYRRKPGDASEVRDLLKVRRLVSNFHGWRRKGRARGVIAGDF